MLKGFFDERFATLLLIVGMFAGGITFLASDAAERAGIEAQATQQAVSAEATAQASCYTELEELGKEYVLVKGYRVVLTFPGIIKIDDDLEINFTLGESFNEKNDIGFPIITYTEGRVYAELLHCGYP